MNADVRGFGSIGKSNFDRSGEGENAIQSACGSRGALSIASVIAYIRPLFNGLATLE